MTSFPLRFLPGAAPFFGAASTFAQRGRSVRSSVGRWPCRSRAASLPCARAEGDNGAYKLHGDSITAEDGAGPEACMYAGRRISHPRTVPHRTHQTQRVLAELRFAVDQVERKRPADSLGWPSEGISIIHLQNGMRMEEQGLLSAFLLSAFTLSRRKPVILAYHFHFPA